MDMNERISALMDGELDAAQAAALIGEIQRDPQARLAWDTYHLASDAMRDTRLLSAGFSARLSERLAAEPTVLAPASAGRQASRPKRLAVPAAAAASVAAVALVGWLAFAPSTQQAIPVAQTPPAPPPVAQAPRPQTVPLPSATQDYLLAHQGFSPRTSLQGMAPYVRTVADTAPAGARR